MTRAEDICHNNDFVYAVLIEKWKALRQINLKNTQTNICNADLFHGQLPIKSIKISLLTEFLVDSSKELLLSN